MRRLRIASLVVAATVAACSDATAPQPLQVDVRTVNLTTDAERIAWPTTPTVEGGTTIRVRGMAFTGCGGPTASAVRRGKRIDVAITGNTALVYCLAVLSGPPAFEATLTGMEPGEYLVHVTVVGFDGSADWVVMVAPASVPRASR